MSDWQPARIIDFHGGWKPEYAALHGRVVRIKEAGTFPANEDALHPCLRAGGRKWFNIHTEDVPVNPKNGMGFTVCEHEILTD